MPMLTTLEAAARLGISPRRVVQLIKAGRLRATKQGRDWLIPERALAAYVPEPVGWKKGRPRKKRTVSNQEAEQP